MKSKNGFTLIELLVVISIIALLIGILLPALGAARESAKNAVCKSNQRQIGIAWTVYADSFKEFYPPSYAHGGSWEPMYESTKIFMDEAGIAGEAFFCPTHDQRSGNANGYYDWDNLDTSLGALHGPVVRSSYNYWTHLVISPYIDRWDRAGESPFLASTWAVRLVNDEISKPWLFTASDDELSDKRIAWDLVQKQPEGFTPESTRHIRGSDGSGANSVFGDGHAEWISYGEMHAIPQGGGITNHY